MAKLEFNFSGVSLSSRHCTSKRIISSKKSGSWYTLIKKNFLSCFPGFGIGSFFWIYFWKWTYRYIYSKILNCFHRKNEGWIICTALQFTYRHVSKLNAQPHFFGPTMIDSDFWPVGAHKLKSNRKSMYKELWLWLNVTICIRNAVEMAAYNVSRFEKNEVNRNNLKKKGGNFLQGCVKVLAIVNWQWPDKNWS